jgi:hypothetical protein
MLRAFVFSRVAVLVRHWFEIGVADGSLEHGARLELRLLQPQTHRGTESAAQFFGIDRPIWRADLFDRLDSQPGSFDAAHFHPRFDGNEPCARVWPSEIRTAPWDWAQRQLSDLASLCAAAAVSAEDDAEDLRAEADGIVATARSFGPDRCTSPRQCHQWTRDVTETVRIMAATMENRELLDKARVEPWLTS